MSLREKQRPEPPAAAPSSERRRVQRWSTGRSPSSHAEDVVAEEPLEIRIEGEPVTVTMRTPGDDIALALGFLWAEGIVRGQGDVAGVRVFGPPGQCNTVDVRLARGRELDIARLSRHVFTSSSCGLCGKLTIDAVRAKSPPVPDGPRVAASALVRLPSALRDRQEIFTRTGGLHAAGLFAPDATPVEICEDIGRHNAVDKVVGKALTSGRLPLHQYILFVSGRVSFEIAQKALAAGVPVVAAVSAPSTLAIDLAESGNQTLVAFVREGRFSVYTHPDRIQFDA